MGEVLATLMGFTLGLMGGGGSILTVPILIYAFDQDPKLAIASGLFIVCISGLVGVFGHFRVKNIDFKKAAQFLPSAMLGTVLGTYLEKFFTAKMQLLIFSLAVIIASFFMIKKITYSGNQDSSLLKSIFASFITGVLTGLVGVGGGFAIVPTLVLLMGVPMKRAVGTSLFIICLNSFIGSMSYLTKMSLPWNLILKFCILSSIGMLIGVKASTLLPSEKLKRSFGVFLLFIGIWTAVKQFI